MFDLRLEQIFANMNIYPVPINFILKGNLLDIIYVPM